MTVHYYYGCPWADGSLQCSDTDSRATWGNVTCKQCLKLKSYGYGHKLRLERTDVFDKNGVVLKSHVNFLKDYYKENYLKKI